jgi:hypothetical protein
VLPTENLILIGGQRYAWEINFLPEGREMVTAVKSETRQTTTVPRYWLLHVQVRNLLSRTAVVGEETLARIDKGLSNQWIQTIGVYGFDGSDRCHVGLELTIDWETHTIRVLLDGDEVRIDRTVFTDNLAPEVQNGIKVFNQAVIEDCLRPKWRVFYAKGADTQRLNRELGFVDAAPLAWAGNVRKETYPVPELPELTVTFLEAIPDSCKEQGLFDRIKDAIGH